MNPAAVRVLSADVQVRENNLTLWGRVPPYRSYIGLGAPSKAIVTDSDDCSP